ncbi:hypothetical protein J6TS1_29230 [Siminovitchia terrae]|uniref:Uncharacterized protein n=1 Tax=Siminovitchia terrae TaxID=1914933 RepID=A0ABQ4KYD7_SIMTE|nr:hypothetical protein J22TS1_14950 [Siminovitchia terrae]GIN97053.1 hypothetical protein J6TS1_29230 [Siminovitchia terrae]
MQAKRQDALSKPPKSKVVRRCLDQCQSTNRLSPSQSDHFIAVLFQIARDAYRQMLAL